MKSGGIYMNKYLRERRKIDEFDDAYTESYLEEVEDDDEFSGWQQGWLLGYSKAIEEEYED